jgi:hypothetical protein
MRNAILRSGNFPDNLAMPTAIYHDWFRQFNLKTSEKRAATKGCANEE